MRRPDLARPDPGPPRGVTAWLQPLLLLLLLVSPSSPAAVSQPAAQPGPGPAVSDLLQPETISSPPAPHDAEWVGGGRSSYVRRRDGRLVAALRPSDLQQFRRLSRLRQPPDWIDRHVVGGRAVVLAYSSALTTSLRREPPGEMPDRSVIQEREPGPAPDAERLPPGPLHMLPHHPPLEEVPREEWPADEPPSSGEEESSPAEQSHPAEKLHPDENPHPVQKRQPGEISEGPSVPSGGSSPMEELPVEGSGVMGPAEEADPPPLMPLDAVSDEEPAERVPAGMEEQMGPAPPPPPARPQKHEIEKRPGPRDPAAAVADAGTVQAADSEDAMAPAAEVESSAAVETAAVAETAGVAGSDSGDRSAAAAAGGANSDVPPWPDGRPPDTPAVSAGSGGPASPSPLPPASVPSSGSSHLAAAGHLATPEDSDPVRREAHGPAPAPRSRLSTAEISAVAVSCVMVAAIVILGSLVLIQRSGVLKRRSILSDPPLDDTRLSYINASTDFSVSELGDEMTNLENLDNDSFLNSLESMTDTVTAQTCWSREVRHLKL